MKTKHLLLFLAGLATAATGQAEVVLSNFATDSTGQAVFGYDDDFFLTQTLAQAVHTGTGAASYTIDEIQISTYLTIDSSILPLLSIYDNSTFPNRPGNVIATMNLVSPVPPPEIEDSQTFFFAPSAPITLSGNTWYWIAVSADSPGEYHWNLTGTPPPIAVDGWSFQENAVSKAGGPWEGIGDVFMTQISATTVTVPEPSAAALAIGAAILALAFARRRGRTRLP